MDTTWAARTEQDLLAELDEVERAIARSTAFDRHAGAGGLRGRVSQELLDLAEREHRIVAELSRRRRQVGLAA